MRSGAPSAYRFLRNRDTALRFLLDTLVLGADEAPLRSSEQRLRAAAAEVADAIADERKAALQ